MELLKIRKVLKEILKEEKEKELKAVKKAVKIYFDGWSKDYTTTEEKDGTMHRIKATLTEKQTQKPLNEQKQILIDKIIKNFEKEEEKQLNKLKTIEETQKPKTIELSIEWKDNRTWGANPRATLWTSNGYFEGSSIGGCGYDKRSTASAQVLNMDKGILNAIYSYFNKKPLKTIKHALKGGDVRDFLGYGMSFYKISGVFNGGVGIDCHIEILNSLGYKTLAYHQNRRTDFLSMELKRA